MYQTHSLRRKLTILSLSAAAICTTAQAQTSINLANYSVTATYPLTLASGGVSGLEASAVAYARDRGTLFYVGDEAEGVIEISLTGQTLGSMSFAGFGGNTTGDGNDAEGLTYLGNGQLVVAEERFQNAYSFTYAAGGSIDFATAPFVSFGPTIGNIGIEGISYDPRNGNFVTVKQDNPAQLRIFNSLNFSTTPAADVTPNVAFTGPASNSSLFGLDSLSDVQTLAPIDALIGTPAAENLLVLSLASRRLIEINRSGQIQSSLDLANILPTNAIEGVTVDENGTIYLVAEQEQLDEDNPDPAARSMLIVLSVPEPGTAAFLLTGFGVLGSFARRRRSALA